MTVERGQTLSHYRLIEKIGEGGMGVVWKAEDTVLGRTVAIKVLPADHARDEKRRKMFFDEARLASSLSEAHIVQVHEFGREGDLDFIVMEYVEGKPLNKVLHGRPMPPERVAEIGHQVARALSKAHRKGLLHRDLKPANILITPDGDAKVVDFGLATLFTPQESTIGTEGPTQTFADESDKQQRSVTGTLPYMSPEQVRGEKLDARSDIFSLGTVLYEMTTGQRPFTGATSKDVVTEILKSRPKPVHEVVPKVPLNLDNIITKALSSRRGDRYQNTEDLAVDLKRLGRDLESGSSPSYEELGKPIKGKGWLKLLYATLIGAILLVVGYSARNLLVPRVTPPPGKVMLAVLPFDNLSGDPEQEFFSDGMTEEMITQLGSLQPQKLGIIARTSVMLFKDTKKPIDQIGQELGVDYLLEGSVRRASDRVRITAQLIQVSDQTHLWAKSYDSDLTDVLALQSKVAQAIAREINIKLTPQEKARLASARTVNPEAYKAYLKGRYYNQKWTEEESKKAIGYFQQAIEKDPTYAPAYVELADCYGVLSFFGYLPPKEAMPKAKAATMKALEIDDTLAEGHRAVATSRFYYDWNWVGAESAFKRAIELNPSYAIGHLFYAWFLGATGNLDEAIAEIKRAQELDPLSVTVYTGAGNLLYFARQYDQAIDEYMKVIDMYPNHPILRVNIGQAYLQKGMYVDGLAELQKAVTIAPGDPYVKATLARGYAVTGKRGAAQKMLDELQAVSKERYFSPYEIALIYAALGQKDQAFEWMEKAYEDRAGWLVWLQLEPTLDPLRSDPRFQDLLHRMNFPE